MREMDGDRKAVQGTEWLGLTGNNQGGSVEEIITVMKCERVKFKLTEKLREDISERRNSVNIDTNIIQDD